MKQVNIFHTPSRSNYNRVEKGTKHDISDFSAQGFLNKNLFNQKSNINFRDMGILHPNGLISMF